MTAADITETPAPQPFAERAASAVIATLIDAGMHDWWRDLDERDRAVLTTSVATAIRDQDLAGAILEADRPAPTDDEFIRATALHAASQTWRNAVQDEDILRTAEAFAEWIRTGNR
jgi:hypothetical protein